MEAKIKHTKDGFLLRGLPTTRLDTFIDAAFAFATTMLVISVGSIPKNYEEFILALKGVPAFLASFIQIMIFWLGHRRWSRYYGIETPVTITISLSLIFVILVYVYPLKLIFTALFSWVSGGWFPSEFMVESAGELLGLFQIYGIGTAVLAGLLAWLFIKARGWKKQLELSKTEMLVTKSEIWSWLTIAVTGLVSALFAWLMPVEIAVYAGFIYASLPITMPAIAIYFSRQIEKERKTS